MSNIWKTIKYLYFLGVTLFSLSCLYLMWIWRNGLLDPVTTTEVVMSDLEALGPWGILIDIFILLIVWIFFKKSRQKPEEEVTGIIPGLLIDLTPLPPPIPPAPPQSQVEDWVWEELQMKNRK